MKTITLALALLASSTFVSNTFAQRYDPRIDVPAIVNAPNDRDYHGDGDWEARARGDLDSLNAEVDRMRTRIGDSRDREVRSRFHDIRRATDRLNAAYARRTIRGWELRHRIDDIRAQLDSLRRVVDERYDRRGGR